MYHLLQSELFRMRKRAQSWILLLVAIGLTALVYGGFAIAARVSSGTDAANLRNDVSFSSFQDLGITMSVGFFSSLLIVIIAAGMMGNEYSWNTLRPLVARAQTRASMLTAKIVALGIYAVLFVLVVVLVVTGMYFVGSWFVDVPSGFSMDVFIDGMGFAMKMLYTNTPYLALAFMLATVFKSNAAGIAGALGFSFLEEPVWMLLGLASDMFKGAADWGLSANVNALTGFGAEHISDARAYATLGAYTLIFVAITYVVFLRRDVTSG
ncbi:MAG: ABC transporter permease [Thermomicrobiales bacterium]|nr:ABC transporter permease [Thermomicrobiales bacterium]MCO5225962.1 ABC transporter permease [Thermomicrobiales bacterium]